MQRGETRERGANRRDQARVPGWVQPGSQARGCERARWSGGVAVAVAVVVGGGEALDDAFETGRALGEGLDIRAQVRHLGMEVFAQALVASMNLSAEILDLSVNLGAQGLVVGLDLGAKSLVVGAEFGSQGAVIGACVTPLRYEQADYGCAYGEDGDEIGGHGRLLLG